MYKLWILFFQDLEAPGPLLRPDDPDVGAADPGQGGCYCRSFCVCAEIRCTNCPFLTIPQTDSNEKEGGGRFKKISGKRSHTNDTSTTAAATTLFPPFRWHFSVCIYLSGHPKTRKGDLPLRWFPSFFLMKNNTRFKWQRRYHLVPLWLSCYPLCCSTAKQILPQTRPYLRPTEAAMITLIFPSFLSPPLYTSYRKYRSGKSTFCSILLEIMTSSVSPNNVWIN